MKNKIVTYLLLLTVLVVWGVIGYKLVNRSTPVPEQKGVPEMKKKRVSGEYLLKLDYADPFLKNSSPVEKNPEKNAGKTSAEEPPGVKEEIAISCYGRFRKKGEMYYPVKINGTHYILKIGSIINGLQLVYNKEDSLYFIKNKYQYSVKIY